MVIKCDKCAYEEQIANLQIGGCTVKHILLVNPSTRDFQCSCLPGYHPPTCSGSVCSADTCKNGGTCSVSQNGLAQCACVGGYRKIFMIKNNTLIINLIKDIKFLKVVNFVKRHHAQMIHV